VCDLETSRIGAAYIYIYIYIYIYDISSLRVKADHGLICKPSIFLCALQSACDTVCNKKMWKILVHSCTSFSYLANIQLLGQLY